MEKWPQIIAHFGPLCAALAKQIIITFSICFLNTYTYLSVCVIFLLYFCVFGECISIAWQIKISHAFSARTTWFPSQPRHRQQLASHHSAPHLTNKQLSRHKPPPTIKIRASPLEEEKEGPPQLPPHLKKYQFHCYASSFFFLPVPLS